MSKINLVNRSLLHAIINTRNPEGLFLAKEGHLWIAVDNTAGDVWTEEFRWKFLAVQWLRGKFEMSDLEEWVHTKPRMIRQFILPRR